MKRLEARNAKLASNTDDSSSSSSSSSSSAANAALQSKCSSLEKELEETKKYIRDEKTRMERQLEEMEESVREEKMKREILMEKLGKERREKKGQEEEEERKKREVEEGLVVARRVMEQENKKYLERAERAEQEVKRVREEVEEERSRAREESERRKKEYELRVTKERERTERVEAELKREKDERDRERKEHLEAKSASELALKAALKERSVPEPQPQQTPQVVVVAANDEFKSRAERAESRVEELEEEISVLRSRLEGIMNKIKQAQVSRMQQQQLQQHTEEEDDEDEETSVIEHEESTSKEERVAVVPSLNIPSDDQPNDQRAVTESLEDDEEAPPPPTRPAWMDEAKTAQEAAQKLHEKLHGSSSQNLTLSSDLSPSDVASPPTKRKQLLRQDLRKGSVSILGKKNPFIITPNNNNNAGTSSGNTSPPGTPSSSSGNLTGSSSGVATASATVTISSPAPAPSGADASKEPKKKGIDVTSILQALTPKVLRNPNADGTQSGQSNTPQSASPKMSRRKSKSMDKGGILSHISPKLNRRDSEVVPPLAFSSSSSSVGAPVQPDPEDRDRDFVTVVYDFAAENESQLDLKRGERIIVYACDQSGWWKGRDVRGKVGIFPRNRVVVGALTSSTSSNNVDLLDAMPVSPRSPRTAVERPPEFDADAGGTQLVLKRDHELRVLEVQIFQAMNLEVGAGESVYLEFQDGKQVYQTGMGKPPVGGGEGISFGDEFRLVGDRSHLSRTEPLSARVISVNRQGRDDLVGIVQLPVHECPWEDTTWFSMRWCPVLGMLQEVKGIVQVILRRITCYSDWHYVAARCSATAVSQLSPTWIHEANVKQIQLPGEDTVLGNLSQLQTLCNDPNPNLAEIARVVEEGASFDAEWRNARRQTLLHLLAQGGQTPLCRLVVTLGGKVTQVDQWGNTPLHYACLYGNWDSARLLLNKGAPANVLNAQNCSPLHMCLMSNVGLPPVDLVSQLLTSGSDAGARSNNGSTPLHCIAGTLSGDAEQRFQIAALLVQNGSPTHAPDDDGCSPYLLWLLCHYDGSALDDAAALRWLRLLREVPGGPVAESLEPETPEERSHRMQMMVTPEQRGDTVLWRLMAVRPYSVNANDAMFMELLARAQINRRYGLYGNTLFLRVCMSVDEVIPYALLLLENRPDMDVNATTTKGLGPLHILAARGDDALVPLARRLCEDYRSDPNAADSIGQAPLHFCSTPGMGRLFLVHGGNPAAVSNMGQTVLHSAYAYGGQAYIDLILAALKKDDQLAARNYNNQQPPSMLFNRHKMITVPHYPNDVHAKRSNGLYTGIPPGQGMEKN